MDDQKEIEQYVDKYMIPDLRKIVILYVYNPNKCKTKYCQNDMRKARSIAAKNNKKFGCNIYNFCKKCVNRKEIRNDTNDRMCLYKIGYKKVCRKKKHIEVIRNDKGEYIECIKWDSCKEHYEYSIKIIQMRKDNNIICNFLNTCKVCDLYRIEDYEVEQHINTRQHKLNLEKGIIWNKDYNC